MTTNGETGQYRLQTQGTEETYVFDAMLDHVIRNCPNPERTGCLSHEMLETFFFTPEQLDLENDPKYVHVVECAECARVIKELRLRSREQAAASVPRAPAEGSSHRGAPRWIAAVSMVLVVILAGVGWVYYRRLAGEATESAVIEPIDLSQQGPSRSTDSSSQVVHNLPRRRIELQLVLPYYRPGGSYQVAVSDDRDARHVRAQSQATATIEGPRTALSVDLDLRHLKPGMAYLVLRHSADGSLSSFPILLK